MDQAGIIRDLLTWLEGHLDQPLSLDNVAAKAGYSKWHLQRMFKDVTGHAIGAYIRARRLSKSAVALRLTARPILDIACSIVSIRSRPSPAPLKNSSR
jgi:AraC-like DNA-binding protein